jgi:hypothetical protein
LKTERLSQISGLESRGHLTEHLNGRKSIGRKAMSLLEEAQRVANLVSEHAVDRAGIVTERL